MSDINKAVTMVLRRIIDQLESGEVKAHSIGSTVDFAPDFVELHPIGSKPLLKSRGGTVTTEIKLKLTYKE
jgi:hypothetical protein